MNRAINSQVNNACTLQHCLRFNGRATISCKQTKQQKNV